MRWSYGDSHLLVTLNLNFLARHCETRWFAVSEIATHSTSYSARVDRSTRRCKWRWRMLRLNKYPPDTVSIPLKIQWAWFQTGKPSSHRPRRRHTCVMTTKHLENSATFAMGTTHIRRAYLKRQHVTFIRKNHRENHLVNCTYDKAQYCLYYVKNKHTSQQPIKVGAHMDGKSVDILVDTGANVFIINEAIYRELRFPLPKL